MFTKKNTIMRIRIHVGIPYLIVNYYINTIGDKQNKRLADTSTSI